MSLLANLGRVLASDEILPTVDEAIAKEPAAPLMLMLSADLHWRRKDAIKGLIAVLTFLKLFTVKGRANYRGTMLRCDREAQADRDALAWAHELISAQRADDDTVAV